MSNLLDGCLVWFTGVLPTWILVGQSSDVRKFTALRAFRLLRVARVVRSNPAFKEMWLLLRGLGDSMRTLFWTIVVMVFVNYLFGIFAVIIIGDSDVFKGTEEEVAQDYFSGLDESLFTLLQVVTGDSWAGAIVRPIMKHIPETWIYFVAYVAIAMFVLLNLITAVIVDNAMEISKADQDNRLQELHKLREREFRQLEALFLQMDADGSGEISSEEFDEAIRDHPEVVATFHLVGFQDIREIKNLFNELDDGDGTLSVDEFVDGLRSMQGDARSKDVIKLRKQITRLEKTLDHEIPDLGNSTGEKRKTVNRKSVAVPGVATSLKGSAATVVDRALAEHLKIVEDRMSNMVNTCQNEMSRLRQDVAILRSEIRNRAPGMNTSVLSRSPGGERPVAFGDLSSTRTDGLSSASLSMSLTDASASMSMPLATSSMPVGKIKPNGKRMLSKKAQMKVQNVMGNKKS